MWDDEIDAAARQLTGGRVPRDLSARVLARLEAPRASSRWRLFCLSSAYAAAIVAAMVVAFVSTRDHNAGDHNADEPQAAAFSPAGNAASARELTSGVVRSTAGERGAGIPADVPATIARRVENPRRRLDRRAELPISIRPAMDDLSLPRLPPEPGIAKDTLTTEQLVTDSIAIPPLEFAAIDLEAVSQ
jgi:hypothetical protein